ncbi:hypothetical protein ACFL0L_03850 [Patescibacteria group bacterium]
MTPSSRISFRGIVWDPEEVSWRVRWTLWWMSGMLDRFLSEQQLDEFQYAVIATTPMNHSETFIGRPMIRLTNGVIILWDNGVGPDTRSCENIPSLVFLNVGGGAHIFAASLAKNTYAWTGVHSFRLFFDDADLVLGRGQIEQSFAPPIPGEGLMPCRLL